MAIEKTDIEFLRKHAREYADPAGLEVSEAYADWYVCRNVYGQPEATMEEMPSHSSEWLVFLETGGRDGEH